MLALPPVHIHTTTRKAGETVMRQFMLVYKFQSIQGTGSGSTSGSIKDGHKVTWDVVQDWQRQIKELNGFTSVFISNFIELEG